MTEIPKDRLVTVFGGSGFAGRHVVRALANDGWRVRVAVRKPNVAHFLKPMGRVGQIQIVRTTVRDDAQVEAALRNADAAINLVGILAQRGRQRFDALHVEAAGRIAAAAKALGTARLVHFSALGASGTAPARYFQSKADGEAAVRAQYPEATIVRPALMFGPEDQFFNRFAGLARFLPILPLYGGGKTRFQPVWVGDVAHGVASILQHPASAGRIYEFAGPEVMTFREAMEFVLRVTERKRVLLSLPFGLGRIQGAILQYVPGKPLTRDQVLMLETDTVPGGQNPGLAQLGIVASSPEAIVPSYLWRFRRYGQFATATPQVANSE
jgi:NADH dehydrogenase